MARPIKETPILKGKDAAKFVKEQKEYADKPFSDKRKEEIMQSYQLLSKAYKS